jgi:hypothetical protein
LGVLPDDEVVRRQRMVQLELEALSKCEDG